jgi:hypothetical protein
MIAVLVEQGGAVFGRCEVGKMGGRQGLAFVAAMQAGARQAERGTGRSGRAFGRLACSQNVGQGTWSGKTDTDGIPSRSVF